MVGEPVVFPVAIALSLSLAFETNNDVRGNV